MKEIAVNHDRSLTRRRALGATALGAGAPMLAACGDADEPAATPSGDATGAESPAASGPTSGSVAPRDGTKGLVATADVPIGGGVILADQQVVVTQPSEGEFRAFSAVCTHAQCLVSGVDTEIECSCHGSRYALDDAAVLAGPAPSPLPRVDVAVRDGQVVRG